MPIKTLSPQQVNTFHRDGYVIVKNFCSKEEITTLYGEATARTTEDFKTKLHQETKLSSWFSPANDVFGLLARNETVVKSVAALLERDSPVCHIQSKLMKKNPHAGGIWEWHQDFAYWQTNHFISADQMVGFMMALTPGRKENGCSRVIKGSHKLGTLIHGFGGKKPAGADPKAVKKALQTMEQVDMETAAGDAIFFHSNLLHRSGANLSANASWSNVSCYSAQSNQAATTVFASWHTPVSIVPGNAILQYAFPYTPNNSIGVKPAGASVYGLSGAGIPQHRQSAIG